MTRLRRGALIGATLLSCLTLTLATANAAPPRWLKAFATFHDTNPSGGLGNACGYDDEGLNAIGTMQTAVSTQLFNSGYQCGSRFTVRCRSELVPQWCLPGSPEVTVTVTDFCPPNYDLRGDAGGWCNPPRKHFDLSRPAFEQIADPEAGIVPTMYARSEVNRNTPLRFKMGGLPLANDVLVDSNSASPTKSVSIKGTNTAWLNMTHAQGVHWEVLQLLQGQALSFKVTDASGHTVTANNVFPANWQFGQTATAPGF
ncbi:RlpA-like double-psi beta-barrel domain-containing protein [Streptomyces acidiscabies]|uniref:Expansin n=1 Tax=Streptomyces acidiscabies TaxID=42234 RepID=A0A0L0KKF5_9ACTN|nr:RlpA-like double-psi beta-barrel domain-containing protein [Streptomyces acidiscabies]KND38318.1 hypothetical protein IQ63_08150 [Streptomyces acidiscabies]